MWDSAASVFTSGTYGWAAFGTNEIENDSNSLKITYGNNINGAVFFFASSETGFSTDLVEGTRYKVTFDTKINTGTARWVMYDGSTYYHGADFTNTSFETQTHYFTAGHVANCKIHPYNMGSGEIIWIDNLSVKAVSGNYGELK